MLKLEHQITFWVKKKINQSSNNLVKVISINKISKSEFTLKWKFGIVDIGSNTC